MRKNKIKNLTEIILPIICAIGLVVYAIITQKKVLLISIIAIVAFAGMTYGVLYLSVFKIKIITRKIKKYYGYLELKNERNLLEDFYVLIYQKKADEFVKEHLKKRQITEINSIMLENTYNKKVLMYCTYKGFRMVLLFDNNSVQYVIDSPARYDGTKANINFEKPYKEDISYEQFADIDELGEFIANLINKLKEKIESFTDTNIVNSIFNGRLLDKVKPYLLYLKSEGLLFVILTPPFIAFLLWALIYFTFIDVNFKTENSLRFYTLIICCFIFSIVFIFAFFCGIKNLIQRRNFKKDYEFKNFSTICEFPNKVKIIKAKPSKYSDTFCIRLVILHFNSIKLIMPFAGESILNNKNIKKCCDECKNIKSDIKYLIKSKIIIDGEKPFVKVIKKYTL